MQMKDQEKFEWDSVVLWLKDTGLTPQQVIDLVRLSLFKVYIDGLDSAGIDDKTSQSEQSH